MRFSLILATLGRDRELAEFVESLVRQTYQDFELIIVDQNVDGKIDAVIARYADRMALKHEKVDFTGAARARDYGIRFCSGYIVAFPDDDCMYESDVLEKVAAEFERQRDLGVLVAGSYDFSKSKFSIGVNSPKPRYFTRYSMMGVEFTLFFNLRQIKREDFFLDHDFGVGSKYSSAEGFELLYRVLRAGNKAFYTPAIKIYHADKDAYLLGRDRMLQYSAGVGAFIRKFFNDRDLFMGYYILRKMLLAPTAKIVLATLSRNPKKRDYYWTNLLGVWHGFLAYRK